MLFTVFLAADEQPGCTGGPRQPAYRAWADALLVRTASRTHPHLFPSVSTRTTAHIGRLVPGEPFTSPSAASSETCAIAIPSETLPLYRPAGWAEALQSHLIDSGIDRDLVDEHLPVCAAPLWPARTDAMPSVLNETRSDLLHLVTSYFQPDIDRYLQSWRPLTADAWRGDAPLETVLLTDHLSQNTP